MSPCLAVVVGLAGWIATWMDEWTDRRTDRWIDGRMDHRLVFVVLRQGPRHTLG